MLHLLTRFNRHIGMLIDTNPALTKIARMELYAAIDTVTHDLIMYNRQREAKLKRLETDIILLSSSSPKQAEHFN